MPEAVLAHPADFDGWRHRARAFLAAGLPPEEIGWSVAGGQGSLVIDDVPAPEARGTGFRVPAAFVDLAREVVQHADPVRFGLLYALLWRLREGERHLLHVSVDPQIHRAEAMATAARRDAHKMKAFVRFREVAGEGGPRYLAWFEPDHHVVDATAPFFARRFAAMRWSILTPGRSVHWDLDRLSFAPGAAKAEVPSEDAMDECWRTYFATIFNPARLNPAAMRSEMPRKYWHNLPEARLIAPLIRDAGRRTETMIGREATLPPDRKGRVRFQRADPAMEDGTLAALDRAVAGCRSCPLWRPATQVVSGEGQEDAEMMLVGEQPGDQEDLAGLPFVGPAGQLLDRALGEAGLDRSRLYLTNAVKHFKFRPRGKRRIHQKPDTAEIEACNGWLAREIALVRPKLVVALGATAARSVLGRTVRIGDVRGRVLKPADGTNVLVTVHPSYLLRLTDETRRATEYRAFVADLGMAASSAYGAA